MKVVMTADTIGGVWTYTIDLCRCLARRGVHIRLVTMGRRMSASQHAAAEAIRGLEVRETDYRLEWMDDPWSDVDDAGQLLLEETVAFDADMIHLNGYAHAALPFGRPVVVVGHSCVDTWWRAVKGQPSGSEWGEYRSRVSSGLAHADCLVAPTHAMLGMLRESYGPHPYARTIHNGRNPGHLAPGNKQPIVLAAGRLWDPAKNFETLDQAAQAIDWPVRIAGPSRSPDGACVECRHAELLGDLTPQQVADVLAYAGIFVLPSRYEPFGLSALEAALSGCALVVSDLPTLREVWGTAATYVDPKDPGAIANAINRLIRRSSLRHQAQQAARERAARYTDNAMADGYIRLYRSLIRGRQSLALPA